jgi:hypothetical protein
MFSIPNGFLDRAISLYSSKVVDKNPAGTRTKDDSADEDNQQFT